MMKQTYSVSGMTCNGCKNSVEKSLLKFNEIVEAKVHLEKKEVEVLLNDKISVQNLQSGLADKFVISEKKEKVDNVFKEEETSEIKQLYPLFLIFTFITTASILIHFKDWKIAEFMYTFMGLFYVVFSFFKFLDVRGFAASFSMYDPVAKILPKYGLVYPFVELVLGLCFLMHFQIVPALLFTIIILGITTVGITKSLLSKQTIKCACLGSVLNLPMTKATFIENSIMIFMAIFMIVKLVSY
ncbi:MAG: MauE/DoxX family redox-associated membrane protein [Polaribacter sp.]